MRCIGLDIGRDFAHVAVVDGSGAGAHGCRADQRWATTSGGSPRPCGRTTSSPSRRRRNTWALADLLGRHAGRVVVSNPLRTRGDRRRQAQDRRHRRGDPRRAARRRLPAARSGSPTRRPGACAGWCRTGPALVRDRTAVRNRVGRDPRPALAPATGDRPVRRPRPGLAGGPRAAARRTPDPRRGAPPRRVLLASEVEAVERAIAEPRRRRSPDRAPADHPGDRPRDRRRRSSRSSGDIGRFGRPAKLVCYLGPRPAGPPVRRPAGDARPHQPGGPGPCPGPPDRGRPRRRPRTRPAGRLPRADQGAAGGPASPSSRLPASSPSSSGTC